MKYTLQLPENYERQPLPGLDEWLAALRSGVYQQGDTFLCKDNRYCCLGVACDLLGRLTFTKTGNWVDFGQYFNHDASLDPSNPLFDYFGGLGAFPKNVWVIVDEKHLGTLASCNDAELTFEQIADIIEKIWKNEVAI